MNVITENCNDGTLKIQVKGILGNKVQREFRAAYENAQAGKYVIDLQNTDNIDSSGLGMLLLLRDFAGGESAKVELINCSEHILDIFNITNFFKLFSIPQAKPDLSR